MVANQTASIDINTIAANVIVTGVAGKRICVFNYTLVNGVATAQSVQWKSGSTNLSGVIQLPLSVGGGLSPVSGSEDLALFMTAPGVDLTCTLTAATQVGGHISYKLI